jgi:hypothetical protein
LDALVDQDGRDVLAADRRLQSDGHDLEGSIIDLEDLVLCVDPCELHQGKEKIFCFSVLVALRQLVLGEVEDSFHCCCPLPPVLGVGRDPDLGAQHIEIFELFVFAE